MLRKSLTGLALSVLALPLLSFCRKAQSSPAVTVYGAASLTDAFRELALALEQRHPGLVVRFNFAGSQQLASQLEQGAPADVFASADQRWMNYVRERGLLQGEASVFARNRLVVMVQRSNPARIGRLEDLAGTGVKLVVAAEAVPAGRYTRQAIAKLAAAPGFPAGYERRVLANVVSQEETVKSVVAKVQLGEADAGVVYRSDVTPAVSPQVRVFDIPDQFNPIASYPIAVLRGSQHPEVAREFVELVLSDEGQRVLQHHGLTPAAVRTAAAVRR